MESLLFVFFKKCQDVQTSYTDICVLQEQILKKVIHDNLETNNLVLENQYGLRSNR